MISTGEIANGAGSALAMARNDQSWSDRFDLTTEQVFKSFWAFLLTIPAHLLAVEGTRRLLIETEGFNATIAGPGVTAFVETTVFLVAWGVELALLVALANRRDIGWKISPLIIGYNWSAFLARTVQGCAMAVALLLPFQGLTPIAVIGAAAFGVWLQWGVLRRSLDTSLLGTVGVIALLVIAYFAVSTILTVIFQLVGLVPTPPAP